MSGEDLYTLYVFAQADEGVDVDPWDRLDEIDQNVWQAVAEQVVRATS
jgi:hypothetical protein